MARGEKTLFDPIATGLYQDGDVARQNIASSQGPKHVLIQGMTGSGKTDGEKPVILTCAARGAVQVIIDVRKKLQSYGMLAPVLDWLITDDGTARAAIGRLINNVIPARTEQLSREGLSSWDPKSSLKFVRFQVEEAWDFVDEDELTEVSLAARSAGVQLIVSVQRGSHDLMSTTLRDQLGTVKCYGLKSAWGASLLDEDVEDAGAAPQHWADNQPGMHYMQQGGLTLAKKAMPIRAYTDTVGNVKFADVAKQLGPNTSKCDMVTAAAWGDLYKNRRTPLQLVSEVTPITVTEQTGAALQTDPNLQVRPMTMRTNEIQHVEESDEVWDPEGGTAEVQEDGQTVKYPNSSAKHDLHLDEPDPDPGVVYSPDTVIKDRDPSRPSLKLGGNMKKVSREEFDDAMELRLLELMQDSDQIQIADFAETVVATGWSRASAYNKLATWCTENRLRKTSDGWVVIKN